MKTYMEWSAGKVSWKSLRSTVPRIKSDMENTGWEGEVAIGGKRWDRRINRQKANSLGSRPLSPRAAIATMAARGERGWNPG